MKVISQASDVDQYYNNLADIIIERNPGSELVFIDTNILIWTLRLDQDSFLELTKWFNLLISCNSLVIPIWVIQEYNSLISTNSELVFSPYKKRLKELENNLKFLTDTARLVIDNQTSKKNGYINKKDFIDQMMNEVNSLGSKIKILTEKSNFKIEDRQKYIERLINKGKSDTKLDELMANISDFEFRFRNLIPPGFEDSNKTSNKYGDVLIWKDILLTSKRRSSTKALFLSLDLKKDWVFNPNKILVDDKEVHNNGSKKHFELHPWLNKEYFDYTSGQIFISDIKTLTEILYSTKFNFSNFSNYKNLAKSIDIQLNKDETEKTIEWLVVNGHKLHLLASTICKWERDPGEVDLDELKEWCKNNIQTSIDWNHVDWAEVFAQLFI